MSLPNLAIAHYHLGHGGVTRVIANHLKALDAVLKADEQLDVALLHGGRDDGWPGDLAASFGQLRVRLHALPELAYDEGVDASPDSLTASIKRLLQTIGFSKDETVLHIHNHSLGKNISLPGAVRRLASDGWRLLLQPHDFAEDFRSANYVRLATALADGSPEKLGAELYPLADHVHYAVLNSRDRAWFAETGIVDDHLHLLPNPVPDLGEIPPSGPAKAVLERELGIPASRPLLLYPVRAIRRKNVGEAILWSALLAGRATVGVSLPTLNPAEVESYRHWRQLVDVLALPFVFETGARSSLRYTDCLAASDAILTTSLAEGFGMVFLESWLAGRRLLGRDLPEITGDFVNAGVDLAALQPSLKIPVSLVALDDLRERMVAIFRRLIRNYRLPVPSEEELERAFCQRVGATVDFGDLDESLQRAVIVRVVQERSSRQAIAAANPWIVDQWDQPAASFEGRIAANQDAIRSHFGLEALGQRLLNHYRSIAKQPVGASVESVPNSAALLRQFLAFSRFRLLRT
ncbi:hypothetical protein Pan216_55770 [Planctomycetes bacterium Pan216]|uniref:Glycosyl transferases group 1 n=1 Tax=Kolteria novifilia TaxID=2527975 RepID=A0A518BCH5_9BACT|nr:hypothetical protein Pan216_55770 [Planctomycetes bacterium Pan216]